MKNNNLYEISLESLLILQKNIHNRLKEMDKNCDMPNEQLLELYDFVMHKIAWIVINNKKK